MKKTIFLFIVCLTWVNLNGQSEKATDSKSSLPPYPVQAPERSIWFYPGPNGEYLSEYDDPRDLVALLKSRNFTQVMMMIKPCVGTPTTSNMGLATLSQMIDPSYQEFMQEFIEAAHDPQANLDVFGFIEDSQDWGAFLPSNHSTFLSKFGKLLFSYHTGGIEFDGLAVDVEPWAHSSWNTSSNTTKNLYVSYYQSLIEKLRDSIDFYGIDCKLGITVHWNWHKKGETEIPNARFSNFIGKERADMVLPLTFSSDAIIGNTLGWFCNNYINPDYMPNYPAPIDDAPMYLSFYDDYFEQQDEVMALADSVIKYIKISPEYPQNEIIKRRYYTLGSIIFQNKTFFLKDYTPYTINVSAIACYYDKGNMDEHVFMLQDSTLEKNTLSKISVYPNPCQNFLYLSSTSPIDWSSVVIYNPMTGRKRTYMKNDADNVIDIHDLSGGFYIVSLLEMNRIVARTTFLKK